MSVMLRRPDGDRGTLLAAEPAGRDLHGSDVMFRSSVSMLDGCTLLTQKCRRGRPAGMGSTMGYSGQTGPMPALSCPPADWWDPAWQAAQTPGVTGLGPGSWEGPAAGGARGR